MKLSELFEGLFQQPLTEGLSSILYHVTSLNSLYNILKHDKFRLAPDIGTSAEIEYRLKDKIYYLSTSRSTIGSYGLASKWSNTSTKIVLDGEKLQSDGYTGKSVAYYQPSREAEDRIFSTKPYIHNAFKYIKSIHILLLDDYEKYSKNLREITITCKSNNIPIYFYNNENDFNLTNIKNATKTPELIFKKSKSNEMDLDDLKYKRLRNIRDYKESSKTFDGYIELLSKPLDVPLSQIARDNLSKIIRYDDTLDVIKNDIHNYRTHDAYRNNLENFISKLLKYKIKNIPDYIQFIKSKYKNYQW